MRCAASPTSARSRCRWAASERWRPRAGRISLAPAYRRWVRSLVLTNAAGAINLNVHPGELVLMSDHINLLGVNPLTGLNDESLGPRFPDMSEVYPREYRDIAKQEGQKLGLALQEGVY